MNGILVVDKPAGWTSQDVCAKLRGLLHERRVGHSGTLDPMATGVLPVFVGRATRAVTFAEHDKKRYTASLRCGFTTDTQDITGTVLTESGLHATEEALLDVLPRFLGTQEQLPPMYSAVKVGGKRLYELARQGKTVERKPRTVTVEAIRLLRRDGDDFVLDITCSKGTYIRALCLDIGAALGCGGVMAALRRTEAGAFTLSDAHTLEEIAAASENVSLKTLLRPVDSLFSDLPRVVLTENQERRCRCGTAFTFDAPEGQVRVYGKSGEFLMLGEVREGVLRTVKSFF